MSKLLRCACCGRKLKKGDTFAFVRLEIDAEVLYLACYPLHYDRLKNIIDLIYEGEITGKELDKILEKEEDE